MAEIPLHPIQVTPNRSGHGTAPQVVTLRAYEVYAHVKKAFLAAPGAQAIYLLGSGWRVMEMIEALEQDLGVPVVHPVPARCWEIQRRLHINQPVLGYGRLLAHMLAG